MRFHSRLEAGHWLGERLRTIGAAADLVLWLPRSDVMVATEVAQSLGCPLATLVVRKIGHPHHRGLAGFVAGRNVPDFVMQSDDTGLDGSGLELPPGLGV